MFVATGRRAFGRWSSRQSIRRPVNVATTLQRGGDLRIPRPSSSRNPWMLDAQQPNAFMSTSTDSADLLCVHVFVTVKEGTQEAFKEASLANARASAKEEGIARFDVVQQVDDSTKFVLVEVYKTAEAPAAHKETSHYLTWRTTVADMMAEPRHALKYKNLFPTTDGGWSYPPNTTLE